MAKEQKLQFNIIFRPEPEGGFTAVVPSLPGCITYGQDLKEAKKMAIDAILGYIASVKKQGEAKDCPKGPRIPFYNPREYLKQTSEKFILSTSDVDRGKTTG
jgi:predicted RNase H-like HicB family nuclease